LYPMMHYDKLPLVVANGHPGPQGGPQGLTKINTGPDGDPMSQPKFNQAETIIQAQQLMTDAAKLMADAKLSTAKMAEVLSQGANSLPKEAQKEMGKKLTAKVSKEEREANRRAEVAKTIKGWESECEAIKAMTPAELAVYVPKFVKTITHTAGGPQFKAGKMEMVQEAWNFGNKPGSVSRAGGTLDKRAVKAERYIFPNNKKGALSLAGVDYRFATSVCKALGIPFNRDSAARVLASAALVAKPGSKVLTVTYTPTDGASVSLLVRATEAKAAGLLEARPEDK
jgi:hypothetical protein